MALTIVANQTQSIYVTGTPTANYKDNKVPMKFSSRYLKIAPLLGDVAFSLNGGSSTDGVVKAGEVFDFEGMQVSNLALKIASGAPDIRLWAWK